MFNAKPTHLSSLDPLNAQEFSIEVTSLRNKWRGERYRNIFRPYKAQDIIKKRSRLYQQYPSNIVAYRLWTLLKQKQFYKQAILTFGSVDVIQAIHASKYNEAVFISGSHVSINSNQQTEPSPKQAGYSFVAIPDIVKQVFKAQEFYDVVQQNSSDLTGIKIDYFKPIVADADNGHGSTTTLMHLTRMFAENGAAGIFIDDQALGTYSTNSLFGKVVVPLYRAINRLVAIRAQLDIMDLDQVLFCRTDCNEATLITCKSDIRDHQFILGSTVPIQSLVRILNQAATFGASDEKLMQLEREWIKEAKLMTYSEAVIDHMRLNYKFPGFQLEKTILNWISKTKLLSLDDQRKLAESYGINIHWSCEDPRTTQGFYRYKGSVNAAIDRGNFLAKYCDVLCYESTGPDYEEVKKFSQGIKKVNPECLLGFDFTTSYNWDAKGINDFDLQNAVEILGEMGFCWQSIKTGGVHAVSLMSDQFCADLSVRGISAYIEDIQRLEKIYGINSLESHIIKGSKFYNDLNSIAQRPYRLSPLFLDTNDKMALQQWNEVYDPTRFTIQPYLRTVKMPIVNNAALYNNRRMIEKIIYDFYINYKYIYSRNYLPSFNTEPNINVREINVSTFDDKKNETNKN